MDEIHWRQITTGSAKGFSATLSRFVLRALSIPYGAGVRLRNLAYDLGIFQSHSVDLPIVSVGNLTVGGTGKTPIAEWIARLYRDKNIRAALLSRGYGATDGPNDEALLLEQNLPDVPHLQGPDRVALARVALNELESQVVILDDGFQHRRLRRDLDILLVDAQDPWGGGWMLPGGPLREPVSSLRRADVIILTRVDRISPDRLATLRAEILRRHPAARLAEARFEPTSLLSWEGESVPVSELAGKRALAFSGIARPEVFIDTLTRMGARVQATKSFPDHHAYRREDVEQLVRWARGQEVDVVVTTQKDQVKLHIADLAGIPVRAVRIEAVIESGEKPLKSLLVDILSTRGGWKT